MATSDSRFKAFKFNSYSKPPPLPPKDSIYLERNSPSISSIDIPPNSPISPPQLNPSISSDRPSSRKGKALAFLKFPKRSPRSPSGSGSGEGSIIVIGNDDYENPPPPEPDSQISTPWNFQHNIHVDEGYVGLPPSWSTSLASAGFTAEEIANIQARRAAGSLAPDLRYLYTERPTSPAVADFQSTPSNILSNPTSRSASLPLKESPRPPLNLVTSSSITRRPPPKRKPPLPAEEYSQNGHKANQSFSSTTHQSSDSHQSNQTSSGPSTSDEHSKTPLARVPFRLGPSYSNDALPDSSPAAHTNSSPSTRSLTTSANASSEFSAAGESEDRHTDVRVVAPKSFWGTKRVIPGKSSNPSLSSLASSAKTPLSSSIVPLYLQQQQMSQSALNSSSLVAAASSSLSTLKVAAASTSLSIATAVRNTKGVIRRGLGTSKDNDDSQDVENPEDEESLDIDAASGADDDVPAGPGGRKAVWQLYTRPKTPTDPSSRSDVNQKQPTNTIGKSYIPFSRSQGSLRSLTKQDPTIKKTNSQVSMNTHGSVSQPSLSATVTASGSVTGTGAGDVSFIKTHQKSESIPSLQSIPEGEGSVESPSHPYAVTSKAASSSSLVAPSPKPSATPRLTLLHQNKNSLDLSSWSEALLLGITKSSELDLGFTFREGEKEIVKGRKEEDKEILNATNTNHTVSTMTAETTRRQQPTPAKPRHPALARPIPPTNVNNNVSSPSVPLVENPPPYPTGRSRSNSRSKPGSPTPPPAILSPLPIASVAHPHYHHYGQSPKPPPAVPLPLPPPSASTTHNNNNAIAASSTVARRGVIPPPPTSVAPLAAASVFSPPSSAYPSQSLKSPPVSITSPDSAQLWSEIETMMNPSLVRGAELAGAGVEIGVGGVALALPPSSVKGSVKIDAGTEGGSVQAQGVPRFTATGSELDPTALDELVGPSSPNPSAALTESSSLILPVSPEEERVATTRVLRAGEGVLGTKAHSQGGERKNFQGRKGDGGDSGCSNNLRNREGKEEGGDGGDYSDQEPIVHISKVPGPADGLLTPDTQWNQGNRDSSRSSSSTLMAEAVEVGATTIVRNISIARRAGAVVLKGNANANPALLVPVSGSSSNSRSRSSPSPPSATESKYPPSPLSSNFGNSSEESAGSLSRSLSPSLPSQDNYPTPVTDSAGLVSQLGYYLDGTQTPSPLTSEKMTFGALPPLPHTTKPQSSRMKQNEGDISNHDYDHSPGSDDEDGEPFSYPDEATVEAVHANMAAISATVPAPRPTIVISDEPHSNAIPTTATTNISTAPLSPFQQYRGWLSDVVAPLEEFIDQCVDPRNHYLDLTEIAEGDSGSVFSARLNPLTASKLRLPPSIQAKDAEEMSQHPEQLKFVAIKSVAIVPSGSPKLVDLERELKLMKELAGHENVLGMDGVYVDLVEDSLWVRMELMERSLADMVGLVGDGLMLQDRMLARFASDVLSALEYLQKHCIAHRDVRSDNLLLNKHGFLKLADFSNAVKVTKNSPMRTDMAGVIYWQAPEVRKPPYNALKVDVWSLGATVWEMAQTEPPFFETQQYGDRWPPLRQPNLYSPPFHDFLRKCSEPPSSRPNPSDLLKHPFIHNACGRPVIVHLLSQCITIEQSLQGVDASP